jgi:hypothetical protein
MPALALIATVKADMLHFRFVPIAVIQQLAYTASVTHLQNAARRPPRDSLLSGLRTSRPYLFVASQTRPQWSIN